MRRGVRSFMMPRVHRVTKPSGAVFKYHRKTRRRITRLTFPRITRTSSRHGRPKRMGSLPSVPVQR